MSDGMRTYEYDSRTFAGIVGGMYEELEGVDFDRGNHARDRVHEIVDGSMPVYDCDYIAMCLDDDLDLLNQETDARGGTALECLKEAVLDELWDAVEDWMRDNDKNYGDED